MREQTNENPGALAGATGAECKAERLHPDDSTADISRKATRQEAWRERNPQKYWAHAALRSGLRRGLVAPQPCAHCGEDKVEAHHEDCDKPLDVLWLCRVHHKRLHASRRAA